MAQVSKPNQKEKVLEVLNKARAHELHAIHLYMHQHYNLDNWDYGTMAVNVKLIAIDEMRHAEMLADRIEELGGVPTAEVGAKTKTGQKVEVIFRFDADLEDEKFEHNFQVVFLSREDETAIRKSLATIAEVEKVEIALIDVPEMELEEP